MKRCTKCGKEKPETEFTRRRSGQKKLRPHCKECIREESQAYNAAHREERRKKTAAYYLAHRKEKQEKNAAYSKAHPEKARARERIYYARHREKCRAAAAAYYTAHKPQATAYVKMRYTTDPGRKLYACILAQLNTSLKAGKGSVHLVDIIGCTIEELKEEFEEKFEKCGPDPSGRRMSWENHSRHGWHIEHIIPFNAWKKVLTDPTDLLKACWNHTNLRPWWSDDNWSKGAKIPGYTREPKPRLP
jgi:hypothetical protein